MSAADEGLEDEVPLWLSDAFFPFHDDVMPPPAAICVTSGDISGVEVLLAADSTIIVLFTDMRALPPLMDLDESN